MVRKLIAWAAMIAAALPAAAVGLQSLAAAAGSVVGANPQWAAAPVNITEAAAMRDQATVVRLMDRGVDAHARYELRKDLVFDEPATMTPFEAAIATERAEVASLMLWNGYRIDDPGEWRQLRCLAQLEDNSEIGALLDTVKPAGAVLECSGVIRPWTR